MKEEVDVGNSDTANETFVSDGDSEDNVISYRGEVQVEEDLDEMSDFVETDDKKDEDYPKGDVKWEELYMAKERHDSNECQHFLARFIKYLRHAEGGILSDQQSLIHMRQVHKVMETLDEDDKDVLCLTWCHGMKIWDEFCIPNLRGKLLTGNTIETYLKSIEMFACFVEKVLFYKTALLTDLEKIVIVQLQLCMSNYQKAVHCQTANEKCRRDVEESYSAVTPDNLKELEESDLAKQAVKLIGKTLDHHVLSKTGVYTRQGLSPGHNAL